MIVSNLKYSDRFESLHPRFKELFDYVKNHDLLNAETGRIELHGDELFINNVAPECIAKESQPLEMHRIYIDVHILLEGDESIGWKPIDDIVTITKPYSEDGDCALSDDLGVSYIPLHPGDFVIVYPEDAHAPLIGSGKVRKLIAKVKL